MVGLWHGRTIGRRVHDRGRHGVHENPVLGDFLSERHTLKHFKTETHFPDLIDSQRYEAWQAAGSKTLFERANEKVRDILETYEVDPLPKDVVQGIREVVERADEALA